MSPLLPASVRRWPHDHSRRKCSHLRKGRYDAVTIAAVADDEKRIARIVI
jgi:hypothetical protein